MAKNSGILIALGGLAAFGLAMAGREKIPVQESATLPDFVPTRGQTRIGMCKTLAALVATGETFSAISAETLSLTYLATAFPEILWPNIPLAGSSLETVWRSGALVLAESILADPQACGNAFAPADSGEIAQGIIDSLTEPQPRAQHFYKVRPGDSSVNIIQRVFEAANVPLTSNNFEAYGLCIASGPQWNFYLYSRPEVLIGGLPDPQSAWTRHSAGGEMRNILLAFEEANEDAQAAVGDARRPAPNENWPEPAETKFSARGLLWLPPIFDTEGGDLSCGQNSWSDGTTTLDPPPELMAKIGQGYLSQSLLNL